ncbi:hypothetical protein BT96DRAFT_1006882 [Gymnopus androsaceus JB14]|uniref:Uncharacterized protein n=1 Tax=Gymnopus androsaceus JB14 TaxID=1447944 RepID=A0A6A4GIU5_9AGAR|nr:hypothetical protein BT96DRAFT_1006882 [Gymnopus androsaceus JB14]
MPTFDSPTGADTTTKDQPSPYALSLKPNKLPASFGQETITGNDNSKDELSSMPMQGLIENAP